MPAPDILLTRYYSTGATIEQRQDLKMNDTQPKILIIEDHDDFRNYLVAILENAGFNVHASENGETALEYLNQHPHPDLVTLDLTMPVMDGEAFLEKIADHEKHKKLKVLVVSSDTDMTKLRKKFSISGNMSKIFSRIEFIIKVKQCLILPLN